MTMRAPERAEDSMTGPLDQRVAMTAPSLDHLEGSCACPGDERMPRTASSSERPEGSTSYSNQLALRTGCAPSYGTLHQLRRRARWAVTIHQLPIELSTSLMTAVGAQRLRPAWAAGAAHQLPVELIESHMTNVGARIDHAELGASQ